MPNDYFQFKQFTVKQGQAAMKVTTDACLFGGWVAENFRHLNVSSQPLHALDIGTGTGLLSLMIAQKVNALIDAIEIDSAAVSQAAGNFAASKWSERLKVIAGNVRTYAFEPRYDLIFSNPPFYENDLRSPDDVINHARHDTALTLTDLAAAVSRLLKQEGNFAVLLPYHRHAQFLQQAAREHLLPVKYLFVKPTPKHQYTRVMQLYKKTSDRSGEMGPVSGELIIKEVHHSYSPAFISYMEDYYLSL